MRMQCIRASRAAVAILLATLLLGPAAGALRHLEGDDAPRSTAAERPRLCVLIAVDQMIPEQLERLEPWLEGGLGRLAREGLVFRQAFLPYGVTETGPGHVTLSTGRLPARHGVIANQWIDAESGRSVYCVEDAEARSVTGAGPAPRPGSRSWRNVRGPGLGDLLRETFPAARVVSIAGKDRSAVGMGGARPDVVLWWDRSGTGFQSSTYYCEVLPPFVHAWNAAWHERVPARWEPLLDAPLAGSGTYLGLHDGRPSPRGRGSLPQTLPLPDAATLADADARSGALSRLASRVYDSPFVDTLVIDVAERSLEVLELGRDPARVDLLALGLSACDVVGHSYGPYSFEVTDLLLRLDRELGRLFRRLDADLGPGAWMAVLSADHGVLELPEELARRGVGARRVEGRELAQAMQRVAGALEERLGVPGASLRREASGLYLGRAELRAAGVGLAEARAVAREALLAVPWIARAWSREELSMADPALADPWLTLALASYDPERGPDVVYHLRPWHLLGRSSGTSHGSPYPYDRRVPLVFLGPGFAPGTDHDPVSILDVVPTILDRVGSRAPSDLPGTVR